VIDSLLKNEEIDNTIEKIQRNIKNNGGVILDVDRWGKKRLAYEIKKRQYGYYVEIIFQSSNFNVISVIERDYSLDENILRYLTTVLPPKALELREQKMEKEKVVKEEALKEAPAEEKEDTPEPEEEQKAESDAIVAEPVVEAEETKTEETETQDDDEKK
jgi:small subunit ribosomal protein S6